MRFFAPVLLFSAALSWANSFLFPADGSTCVIGETTNIQWRPTTDGTISLILLLANSNGLAAVAVDTVCSDIPNTGFYVWTVPSSLAPSSSYQLEIIDSQGGTNNSAFFKILQPSATGSASSGDAPSAVPQNSPGSFSSNSTPGTETLVGGSSQPSLTGGTPPHNGTGNPKPPHSGHLGPGAKAGIVIGAFISLASAAYLALSWKDRRDCAVNLADILRRRYQERKRQNSVQQIEAGSTKRPQGNQNNDSRPQPKQSTAIGDSRDANVPKDQRAEMKSPVHQIYPVDQVSPVDPISPVDLTKAKAENANWREDVQAVNPPAVAQILLPKSPDQEPVSPQTPDGTSKT